MISLTRIGQEWGSPHQGKSRQFVLYQFQQGQSYSFGLRQVPTVPRWWSSSRSLSSSAPRQA
jgi:hypothetical protein